MMLATAGVFLLGLLVVRGTTPSPQVEEDRLDTRRSDGLVILEGEPFTGVAVHRDEADHVTVRLGYRGGRKHGLAQRWHANGALSFEATYQDGRRDGSASTWWPDGTLRSEASYRDGVPHGVQREWYRSGALFKEVRLNRGREEGLQRAWRENGKLFANYEARDGRVYGLKRVNLCYELSRLPLEVQLDARRSAPFDPARPTLEASS
jgi:antitoxin component YwqK of YwqJK toxin-antitoxin module